MSLQSQLDKLHEATLHNLSLEETLSLEEAVSELLYPEEDVQLEEAVDVPAEDANNMVTDPAVDAESKGNDFNKFQFFNQDHIPEFNDSELNQFNPDQIDGSGQFPDANEMNTVQGKSTDIPNVTDMVKYLLDESASSLPEVDLSGITPEANHGDHLALGIQEFAYVSDPDRSVATNDIPDLSVITGTEKSIVYPPQGKKDATITTTADRFSDTTLTEQTLRSPVSLVNFLTGSVVLAETNDPELDESDFADDGFDGNTSIDNDTDNGFESDDTGSADEDDDSEDLEESVMDASQLITDYSFLYSK